MRKTARAAVMVAAVTAAGLMSSRARAALTFTVDPNGWPDAARRNAAVAALQAAVNRYNAYGDFGNYNIYAYYNAGIPTAQSNYLGSIGYGGTYPNERVTMHELGHYLGSGTYGTPWDGARGEAMIDQFDGLQAQLQGDSQHFWPYGLNYDSEGAEINKQRQVALIYAQRADMGIGFTAIPGSATAVSLRASDATGESSFNYASTWSDNRFAHPNVAYSTGNFILRTPASDNSFTFVGDSLRINNTNGTSGGLQFKGTGTTGVTSFKNLILDGGYVRHASGAADFFRLGGKVTLASSSTIDAAQGPITVSADIGGSGSLTKRGSFPLTLAGGNTYTGSTTINAGLLRLTTPSAVASYSFDNVSGTTVINGGTGGAAMNGRLTSGATIVAGGRSGNAVSLANGASVNINNPIADLGPDTSWTVSAWVRTAAPGGSILTKGDGSGWASGNTIFYLGDGSAGGSGGIPGAVRWGGGFFQASPGAAVTNNAWHQVTYTNDGGNYAIYVDGIARPLSPGNSGFSAPDVGTVVRLGVSTDTVPADGAVNYNGLLDGVQFYRQSLSAAQAAALFQGRNVGPLPSTTDVTIAAGATLDVNGLAQQIGSLSGPAGSAVTLGAGQLTVSSATSTQFAGTISGAGGALIKAGTGTLVLGGRNTYTGPTTVSAGTLGFGASQHLAELNVGAGADAAITPGAPKTLVMQRLSIAGQPGAWSGRLDLAGGAAAVDYDKGSVSPLQLIADQVRSGRYGAAGAWSGRGITSSTANASNIGVGYAESAVALGPDGGLFAGETVDGTSILLRAARYGDANLDGVVGCEDLLTLRRNLGAIGDRAVWQNGDFNYDGRINASDLVLLRRNYGATMPATAFAARLTAVPEPGAAAMLLLGAAALRRRRR